MQNLLFPIPSRNSMINSWAWRSTENHGILEFTVKLSLKIFMQNQAFLIPRHARISHLRPVSCHNSLIEKREKRVREKSRRRRKEDERKKEEDSEKENKNQNSLAHLVA